MSFQPGAWAELLSPFKQHLENKMGQLNGYDALQNSMMQQNLSQNPFLNSLVGQSGLGLGGQLLGQYIPPLKYPPINPPPNTIPRPGIREAFSSHLPFLEVAKSYGYEYAPNKNAFVHKNGGFVSMKMIQDRTVLVEELFIKGRTPNITWLNERVDEIRVKLC